MSRLTPKQEKFCLAYIETGNASGAYCIAYDALNMKPETINRKAKELLDNGKITARLNEIQESARKVAQVTLQSHLEDLKRLRDMAVAKGKFSVAVAAEIARGKAAGLYSEKVDFNGRFEIVWSESY